LGKDKDSIGTDKEDNWEADKEDNSGVGNLRADQGAGDEFIEVGDSSGVIAKSKS
jgi:hypothetical protein